MILSMTGFGTGCARQGEMVAVAEIRTVNHRFLDLHVRIAREYAHLENEVAQGIRRHLARGRVDVSLTIQRPSLEGTLVDRDTARGYLAASRALGEELGLRDDLDLRTLLTLPGVIRERDPGFVSSDAADDMKALVEESMSQALEGVLRMRRQEGEALQSDIAARLLCIRDGVQRISALIPATTEEFRSRLEERLNQLLAPGGIDPQRLAQEVALLADRSDVSEEIARLDSHLTQLEELLVAGGEAGKRMDFLLQETQREVNTILSKAGNLDIKRAGIGLKAEIEKIREQAQNIE